MDAHMAKPKPVAWDAPKATADQIAAALQVHRIALAQSIREAGTTWTDGRILMLHQTIQVLEQMEGE
jgi:hypothetical protein